LRLFFGVTAATGFIEEPKIRPSSFSSDWILSFMLAARRNCCADRFAMDETHGGQLRFLAGKSQCFILLFRFAVTKRALCFASRAFGCPVPSHHAHSTAQSTPFVTSGNGLAASAVAPSCLGSGVALRAPFPRLSACASLPARRPQTEPFKKDLPMLVVLSKLYDAAKRSMTNC